MYIACPKCDTKFIVTEDQIGENGKKVKCSKCSNIWHQDPDNHLKIEPIITNTEVEKTKLMNGVNLPALLPINVQQFLYGLPILLLGLTMFMSVVLFPNFFITNFNFKNKNFSIYDIQVANNHNFGKMTVSYKIQNLSNENQKMSLVRIRLFDKNNKIIESKIDNYTNVSIPPNQNATINTEFAVVQSEAKYIEILLGNKLDLILH